jgi:hypothetical protein
MHHSPLLSPAPARRAPAPRRHRRAEITVFLEFATAARTDPALDHLAREAAAGTRTFVRRVLIRNIEAGGL